jgi:hypothetical protein
MDSPLGGAWQPTHERFHRQTDLVRDGHGQAMMFKLLDCSREALFIPWFQLQVCYCFHFFHLDLGPL